MAVKPLSIQLYTLRDHLARDVDSALSRLAQIGYTQVEPFAFTQFKADLVAGLKAHGLAAPTAHMRLLGADLPEVFAAAKEIGISTVIDPLVDPKRWTTREDVAAVAAEINAISREARDHGLTIGYHNHAFELENRIEGVPALEVFADDLADDVVLELDTYWAEVGGVSCLDLIARLEDRLAALHIKDGPKTKENLDQVAVGAGSMPIAEIIAASPDTLHVVELDDYRGDVFDAAAESLRFLTGVRGGQ